VLGKGVAEHVELALIPSGHDVEAGTAAAGMIDRHQRLCRKHRMHDRHVHRREDRDLLGDRPKCGCKCECLEAMGANIEFAAKSLPARDRQDEFEAGPVDHFRDSRDIWPARLPSLRHLGDRNSTVGVEREQAELQPVGIVKRVWRSRHAENP
jgi:hypothetical protein